MPAYNLTFIYIETVLLIVLAVFLVYKSLKLTQLFKQLSELKRVYHDQIVVDKERDDFLAMLVHELRSPLSVMKGAADLMLKDASRLSKEQIETLLEQIKNSSIGMLKIVNDILDVSKIDSGKFEVTKKPQDINALLSSECQYYQALALTKQIKLECTLDTTLPPVNFDSDRIRQVLNNLISNAIKFTQDSGVITVRSRKNQAQVFVSIEDTGDGISDTMKHKLFHKFVQLGTHPGVKEHGTGLGLVVAKGIVEAHGGEIWIEDNKPKGAKFVFSIPLI